MNVWIIKIFGSGEDYIEVAMAPITAYNYCRNYINHLNFDSEYDNEMCLNELAHSYSESRNEFGVKRLIKVVSQPTINGFKN